MIKDAIAYVSSIPSLAIMAATNYKLFGTGAFTRLDAFRTLDTSLSRYTDQDLRAALIQIGRSA